jgi:uncharacterized protein YaiE (UPF0345 family)
VRGQVLVKEKQRISVTVIEGTITANHSDDEEWLKYNHSETFPDHCIKIL